MCMNHGFFLDIEITKIDSYLSEQRGTAYINCNLYK